MRQFDRNIGKTFFTALLVVMLGMAAMSFRAFAVPDVSAEMLVDTTRYSQWSYIRFVSEGDSIELSDDEFFDIAGKVTFPVNKYSLPENDSLIVQLRDSVFRQINEDSLEIVRMLIRGAASPEGPHHFNKFLGKKRAQTLLDFIKKHLNRPVSENICNMDFEVEDYKTLCIMMRRRGDPDYVYVQTLCDQYMPRRDYDKLKQVLYRVRGGRLWRRLLREYFPYLRAARVVLFFKYDEEQQPKAVTVDTLATPKTDTQPLLTTDTLPAGDDSPARLVLPRRELLSVKTNLLFDVAYIPGYDRWCPIPNIELEYYPLHGHFTFGASLDNPWWTDYHGHKFFEIRNWQLHSRYYLKGSRDDRGYRSAQTTQRPRGAAFSGLYLSAYAHAGVYCIGFDADRGWKGEGYGAGLGIGYVMPLSKSGHWRLEFGAQVGFFSTKYDPFVYEHPVYTSLHDDLYYYDWIHDPDLFNRRAHRFTWIGPTRIGVTLSYDLLYRRQTKKGISFNPTETVEIYDNTESETTKTE